MNTKSESPSPHAAGPAAIDWREVARAALGSAFVAGLVGGALHVLSSMIAAESERACDESPEETESASPADDGAEQSAALLGIGLDADEAEIRAALRARLTASRAHPDHGGDGGDAAQLIAARDRLVDRARRLRCATEPAS